MFKGCTFDNQNVTSKNDGGLYQNIYSGNDGILWGCSMSVTTDTLTVQTGEMVIGGRLIWVDGATQIPFTGPIANGYGQVVITIDLSKIATVDEFEQVEPSVVYSTTATFPELTHGQINSENGDMIYQQELAVVSIAGSNITGITRQIGAAQIDAEKLGGQLPAHYAKQSDMSTAQTNISSLQIWQGSVTAPKTFQVITMLSSLAYDAGWSWDDGFSINIIITCAVKADVTDSIPQSGVIGNLNGTGFTGPAATLNFPCICQKANGTVVPGWAWVATNGEIYVYSPMGAVYRVSTYITYPK